MESHTKLGAGGSKGVYELDDEVAKIPYDCSLARVGPDILNANIDMYEDVGIPYAETHIDDLPDNFSSDEDLRDFAFYQDKADRTPDDLETDAEIDRWLQIQAEAAAYVDDAPDAAGEADEGAR